MSDAFTEGWQYHQAGDLRRAEEVYRRILRAEPRDARTWSALGDLCAAGGRLAEAEACLRHVLEVAPGEARVHRRLGKVLLQQGRPVEAEAAYRRCLELAPQDVEALGNLGYALGEQRRPEEAKACYRRALALRPDLAEIHHNLGNLLRDERSFEEAEACYREALRLRPDYAKAHVNRGVALLAAGDLERALRSLEEGVRLQPASAEAHSSLATAYQTRGRLDDALAEYEAAIRLRPDYAEPHWNRALQLLLRGDYARGWPEYEWRWRVPSFHSPLPGTSKPRWDGGPLEGRTILLWAEQGLGDTLQFVRYAPLLKARGARVVVQCQPQLVPLLSRTPGIDRLLGWDDPAPDGDVWVPFMSVPALVRTTVETIPAEVPYLFADPERVGHWRRQLAAVPGFKVGIAWQGNTQHGWDRHRSVPLAHFEPLARVPGVSLVSLQKGPGSEQLQELAGRFPVLGLGDLVDQAAGAFTDTAAVLRSLDLVISVDTALAHLAGGMAVPGWVPVHVAPDWRWLLGREDSPWYPSLRLFRQAELGNWQGVFRRMADELRKLAAGRAGARTLLVEVAPGELLDKITILQIKSERITDPAKLRNVHAELRALAGPRESLGQSAALAELTAQLKAVNERLWDIEDEIRLCERARDFGPRFIELARSVYVTNDRRAAVKRAINELLNSHLVEEKSYADYSGPP
jgi:Flp pilus assembly protein TadD